jgi:uncharacterized membrane protein YeaQ/YmgE (transglycosylase-associated protein family)
MQVQTGSTVAPLLSYRPKQMREKRLPANFYTDSATRGRGCAACSSRTCHIDERSPSFRRVRDGLFSWQIRLRSPFARHLFNVRTRKKDMNFIIWLIVGGLVGWVASIIMKSPEGIVMNVVVGIVGAMLGGWLISPLLGVGTINQNNFSLPSLLVSLVGAVILLAIVNIFRRGRTR